MSHLDNSFDSERTKEELKEREPSIEMNIENDNDQIAETNVENETPRTSINDWIGRTGTEKGAIIGALAATFDTGVLTFPSTIENVGLIPGVIIFLIVSFSTLFTLNLLIISSLNTKIFSYSELTNKSLGKAWFMIYNFSALFFYSGAIMAYALISYQFIGKVCGISNKDLHAQGLFYLVLCIFCAGVQSILSLWKNLQKLNITSFIVAFTLLITVLIVVIESPFYSKILKDKNIKLFNVKEKKYWDIGMDFIGCFTVLMFGYLNHNNMVMVIGNINHPTEKKCNRVLYISFIIEFVVYGLMAFVGYLSQREEIDEIFINRNFKNSVVFDKVNNGLMTFVKVLFFISLNCLIPIRFNIIRECYTALFSKYQISRKVDIIITVAAFLVMNVIVYFVKKVTSIIQFFSGIFGVMLVFFIPLFIFMSIYGPRRKRSIVGMGLFIFFLIIGIISNIKSIYQEIMVNKNVSENQKDKKI